MAEEKEIKVRILDNINSSELTKSLETIFHIKFDNTKKIKDVYYDLKNNIYFNLNHCLRLRNDEEIAYKALFYLPERTSNPWFVLEKEYKLPISNENMYELLETMNLKFDLDLKDKLDIFDIKKLLINLKFTELMIIDKIRYSAHNKDFEICVDSIDNLGLFLEVEAERNDFLKVFIKKLPFKYEELRHGYTTLFAEEILKLKVPDFNKKFLENPDWNFLPGQKEIIRKLL